MRECELNSKECHMHIVLVQLYIEPDNDLNMLCEKFLSSFPVVLKVS